jgi:hypothetical protein
MVAGMIVGMLVSGMLIKRLGRQLLHIGIVFIAAGTTALALMLTGVHSASTWNLVPGLLLAGAGAGMVLGQLIQFILAAVSMNEVGSASGVMEASQQLSTSLGVAVLGTIFLGLFKHHPATNALRVTSWVCLVPWQPPSSSSSCCPNAREEKDNDIEKEDRRRPGDFPGYPVAVSGSTTVVGAPCHNPGTGAAHLFTRPGTAWSQHAELTAADGATSGFLGDSAAIPGPR